MDFSAWMATPPIRIRLYPHYDVARYGMPKYQTKGSCCFDLVAALGEGKSVTLAPGQTIPLPTGLGIEPDLGHPIYQQSVVVPEWIIRSRSGLAAKFGVCALGGIIDYDYPEEGKVILFNSGDKPFVVEDGMRIAQACVSMVWRMGGVEIAEAARVGGLGSTGVK